MGRKESNRTHTRARARTPPPHTHTSSVSEWSIKSKPTPGDISVIEDAHPKDLFLLLYIAVQNIHTASDGSVWIPVLLNADISP